MTGSSPTRDHRLDVVRGAALFVIALNHSHLLPGTVRIGALYDAADVFIFISGFVCGLAYYRAAVAGGFAALARKAWRRSLVLAASNLVLIGFVTAVGVIAEVRFGVASDVFRVGRIVSDPAAGLLEVFTFRGALPFVDILTLYVLLTAFLPLVLAVYLKSPPAAWLLSILVWLYPVFDDNLGLPSGDTLGLNFRFGSPLSWQLLFFIGLVLGTELRKSGFSPALTRGRMLAAGAVLMVCYGAFFGLPDEILLTVASKRTVRPFRVLELLAAGFLLTRLLPPGHRVWNSRLLEVFRRAGARALPFFCVSTALASVFLLLGSSVLDSLPERLAGGALFAALLALLSGTLK